MKELGEAANDLKEMINAFREAVDTLAGTLLTTKGGMSPEELQAKVYALQERIRQMAEEKYTRVLAEAARAEAEAHSEFQAKRERIKEFREQADRASTILNALTGAR
jgi:chromosome segregation ATPase